MASIAACRRIYYINKTEKGKYFFDKLALKIPIVENVNKMVITANFCRTLHLTKGLERL